MPTDFELDVEMYEEEDEDAYDGPDALVDEDEYNEDEDEDYEPADEEIEEAFEDALDELSARPQTSGSSTVGELVRTIRELQDDTATPEGSSTRTRLRVRGLSIQDVLRLLGGGSARSSAPVTGSRGAVQSAADQDGDVVAEVDDDYDDYLPWGSRRQRVTPKNHFPEVTEPQQKGLDLLMGGEFGRVGNKVKSRAGQRSIAMQLMRRGAGAGKGGVGWKEDVSSNMVPNSNGTTVASYHSNVYSGQYSTDSSFYYTCAQNFRLHIYDTRAPPVSISQTRDQANYRRRRGEHVDDPGHESTMKVLKTVQGQSGRWTITDSHLSPDNERLIYASVSSTVYMTSTVGSSPSQVAIRFADTPAQRGGRSYSLWGADDTFDSFGIWSCRFSADGKEVVAGGSGKIFVYDLEADRRTVKISAHNDDVNSCCWADTASGNVLISASDDSFLKVWDRRSLSASPKPSGVLIGHTEGITNVNAKGDGRYVISNGKDQSLRLWDLRYMRSSADFERVKEKWYGVPNYDYRNGYYPKPRHSSHPDDCSVMIYRGHAVLRTLIRCHFSPAETTGAQYIYSGSADGRIHIWSLDGRVVQVLDRAYTKSMTFDPSGPELAQTMGGRAPVCVRDVSWHSQEPVLMSAAWESMHAGSTVARHEWKGLSKMRGNLDDWTQKHKLENRERDRRAQRRAERRAVPGAFESSMDEDEED